MPDTLEFDIADEEILWGKGLDRSHPVATGLGFALQTMAYVASQKTTK